MNLFQLQFIFLSSFVLSFAFTPLFIFLARRFKVLDHPAHRKVHSEPVPYLGGVALFVSFGISLVLVFAFCGGWNGAISRQDYLKASFILGSALGVVFVGVWDDISTISPRTKFLGQGTIACLFAFFGFHFQVFHAPGFSAVPLGILGVPLTVFWILSIVNAFNMIDGVDGLAGVVSAGCLFLLSWVASMTADGAGLLLSLGVLGAVLGFLLFNWEPAKIYLGDAGSGGLGMFLACTIVALAQTHGQILPRKPYLGQPFFHEIFLVVLFVGYPALEIVFSVIRRLLHARPIYRADRGHIHHRLLKAGFSVPAVCFTALSLTSLIGLAAVAAIANYHGWAALLLIVSGVLLGIGLPLLGFFDFLKPEVLKYLRPHYQITHNFISMQRVKLSLANSREEIVALMIQTCAEFGVHEFRINVKAKSSDKKACLYSWERPQEIVEEHLRCLKLNSSNKRFGTFSDRIVLKKEGIEAHWLFEPHVEEGYLDIEYRVLISEFMREALLRLSTLNGSTSVVPLVWIPGLAQAKVGSSILRYRHFNVN